MSKALQKVEDDDAEYGPAMSALNSRQRSFVMALFTGHGRHGRVSEAYLAAGYSGDNANAVAASASRLLHSDSVQAAISEVCRRALGGMAHDPVRVVQEIMSDPSHEDRLRAAGRVLDHAAPTVQQISVTHEDITPASRDKDLVSYLRELIALGVVREKLIDKFGFSGLSRYERLMQIEDATFTEVVPTTAVADDGEPPLW
jgi:hypothetical protein